jgi:hypothetical protein
MFVYSYKKNNFNYSSTPASAFIGDVVYFCTFTKKSKFDIQESEDNLAFFKAKQIFVLQPNEN